MAYAMGLRPCCRVIAEMIGNQKGESAAGFLLGFIVGPLGIVAVLFVRGGRKDCSFCRERIQPAATVRPTCKRVPPSTIITDVGSAGPPGRSVATARASQAAADQRHHLKAAVAMPAIIGVLLVMFAAAFLN